MNPSPLPAEPRAPARRPHVVLLTVAVLLIAHRPAVADSLRFTLARDGRLDALGDAAAESIGRSLLITAATAPVSYVFDVESGAFVREQLVAGELYLERPHPLGRGRWNFAVGYQYYAFSRFDGQDLRHLRDTTPIVDAKRIPLFSIPEADIDIQAHQSTLSATYGLTDAIDLNLVLPVLHTSIDRTDRVRLIDTPPTIDEAGASAASSDIGDIFLRAKVALVTTETVRLAAGFGLRLPSGDVDDFQGTGSVDLQPSLFASRLIWETPPWVRIEAVLNAGMVIDSADIDESEGRWGAGFGTSVGQRLAFETAILGRHAVDRLAPEGAFDFPRCLDGPARCSTPNPAQRVGLRPLFGFDGSRPDYFDLALATRLNVWRDSLFAFAGALIPLNDEGLRTEPAPAVGIEASF